MSQADDIRTALEADSSLALELAVNLFVGEMPNTPDECVCVYDSGGFDPVNALDSRSNETTIFKPTVQIRVRGNRGGYLLAFSLAREIRDALHGMTGYTVDGTRYLGIWAVADAQFIYFDDNKRPIFSINFRMDAAQDEY